MTTSGNAVEDAPGPGVRGLRVSAVFGDILDRAVQSGTGGASWRVCVVFVLIASMGVGCDRSPGPGSSSRREVSTAHSPVDRAIRVLLRDEIDACRVVVKGSFDVRDAGRGTPLARNLALPSLLVEFADGRISFPDLGQAFEVEAVDVLPHDSDAVGVEFSQGDRRRYRGTLRLMHTPERGGAVVNVVDVEDYLIGVVSAELPRSFHEEAFRAQAVAARTFAWYQKQTAGRSRPWDVTATESSQVYLGLGHQSRVPQAARAVTDTYGLVCTWSSPEGERIFCTYYSSTCGGSTQAAGPVKNEPFIPPLAGGVTCDYCRHSPSCRWGPVRVEKSVITERLRDRYPKFNSIGPIERVEVTDRTSFGRPVRLSFVDAQGSAIELEAENFRLTVDPGGRMIRSTFFLLSDDGEAVLLTGGRGFGHGIGMCQYGADGLARAGWTAGRILGYYYPSSRVTRAY